MKIAFIQESRITEIYLFSADKLAETIGMSIDNAVIILIPRLKAFYTNDFSGHDWFHTYRVWKLAEHIAIKENANIELCTLAALLHDVADWKKNEKKGYEIIYDWLNDCQISQHIIQQVIEIISETSFKGAQVDDCTSSLESQIVMDADRLDAIGAIGIARAFTYGGNKNQAMHNPESKLNFAESFEEYKSSQSTTINHFYEKLLLLKHRMNTKTGKKIARKRHKILVQFLKDFKDEWNLCLPLT